jgi:hypothetical protein
VLNRVRLLVRSLLRRRKLEEEMQEGMEAHLARATERLVARGMDPESARRAARLEFGARDSRPWPRGFPRGARRGSIP